MSTANIRITGMHCRSCSMLVTMNLEELAGVTSVACDHATGKTVVVFDDSLTPVASLRSAITEAGYGIESLD